MPRGESPYRARTITAQDADLRELPRRHFDNRTHPRMQAALEPVTASAQTRYNGAPASRNVDGRRTLRSLHQSLAERRIGSLAAAEVLYSRERVWPASRVPNHERLSELDHRIGRIVSPRRMSDDRSGAEQGGQLGVDLLQGDASVPAE